MPLKMPLLSLICVSSLKMSCWKYSIIVAYIAFVWCAPMDLEWKNWKQEQGKFYMEESEEFYRRKVWLENLMFINEHNLQHNTFKLKPNGFADMTQEEFRKAYHREMDPEAISWGATRRHARKYGFTYPSSLDWRNMGFVSKVKNQAGCASSWAFSATGALEGQYYRATRKLESFSEQQLLDCSEGYGNQGCEGGLSTNTFRYVQHQGGICTEGNYPYLGYAWFCADRYCPTIGTCSGFVEILSGSEADLLDATANEGPISVVVDSSDITFQYYSSGIYTNSKCSKRKPNHAMLVVGYGFEDGIDYWILKNSWGEGWGNSGYMKMARNQNNTCGIATAASYPIVYRH